MRRAALLAVVMCALVAPSARAVDVSWSPFGTLGANGWYVSDVWINWTLSNIAPPLQQGCNPTHFVTDTTGRTATCSATDASGTTSKTTTAIKIDQTAPVVRAGAERPTDAGSFYNHPLTVTWSGTDATSGIASCTSVPYAGPDGTGISLAGTCRDRAGNVSGPVAFAFSYDATPPTVANVTVSAGRKTARVVWEASGATAVALIRASARAPTRQRVVYQGTGSSFLDKKLTTGRHYTYIVRAVDQAGNLASRSINVTPGSAASRERLLAPRANARVRRPPLLRWRKVKRASYYNLQLFRNGRKVLSVWPTKPHYQVRRSWRYNGRRHRLVDATYRWYLWAGYGKRSARHYGRLLGQRRFTVR
jgi:hypothetical protein